MRRIAAALIAFALSSSGHPAAAADESGSDPTAWLAAYLRLDTSNPPGNEGRGTAFFRKILHRAGIDTRLFVSPEGRESVYARLEAVEPTAGPLVLLHHIDVVPPGPGWSFPPFAGDQVDGALRGRGAVDDKSLGIAHLSAFLALAEADVGLTRDVVFLAVADEETGGGQGAAWVLERFPELFTDAAVLGEGGNNRAVDGRLAWWGVEVAQKRPLWLRVTARGREGHGSTLNLHTAPHKLIRALARLVDRPVRFRLSDEARSYFAALDPLQSAAFRRLYAEIDEVLAGESPERRLLPGMASYLTDSVQVNVLEAGQRINSAPGEAAALVDARLLPDTDDESFLAELRATLGDGIGVEVVLSSPRVAPSSVDSPLYQCLNRVLADRAPVIPAFIPGVTDARHFRQREIPAYGFSPFALDSGDMRGIHGIDEKISVEEFERGVETMRTVVLACATR